jgi:hypothetical protein
MNWKESSAVVRTNAGEKAVAADAVLGQAEDGNLLPLA